MSTTDDSVTHQDELDALIDAIKAEKRAKEAGKEHVRHLLACWLPASDCIDCLAAEGWAEK